MDTQRTTADLAGLLHVKAATIRRYRTESRPGGRYAGHRFPEPDGHVGAVPWWSAQRDAQILAWARGRVGQGVGGGWPTHNTSPGDAP